MNVTVIVPSLDPDEKLMQVVEGLLEVGFGDIVLVNDGSQPSRAEPFRQAAEHPEVTVLTHEVNRGKGAALKTAFRWILENRSGIDGVVTADGDNQHRAQDILRCAQAMCQSPDKLWLGVRDFSLEHVPARSRLGNTITRSIMRLACGVAVTDTQTGLRAIPADMLELMCRIDGERYEYETEMLLAMRREGRGIGEVVIETVYIDQNQTSHFDTLRDSWKIYKIIFRHMFHSSFLRFIGSSLITTLLEFLIFHSLNVYILSAMVNGGLRTTLSNCIGRVLSCSANFALNRRVAFRAKNSVGRSAARYFLLAVLQLAVSTGLICLFTDVIGVPVRLETLIKACVDTALFLIGYQVQKRWVFQAAK